MSVSIYLRNNLIYMCPVFRTSSGGLEGEPVVVVDPRDQKIVGERFLEVLKISNNILANPEEVEKRSNQVVKAAGVTSYKKFLSGTKSISAALKDNTFIFLPLKNGGHSGPGRGFRPIREKERSVETTNTEELGRAILTAFNDCE